MQFSKEAYDKYIASRAWKNKRTLALERAKNRCERCGFSTWSVTLEVHHKTYEHFGNEPLDDLEVLCEKCHEEADKERAEHGKQKSQAAWNAAQEDYDNARLDGWASKKYGELWNMRWDADRIEQEFYDWLERKGY